MATDVQAQPALPREPARPDLVQRSEPLLLAVALAAAAGVIHVRAGIEHAEHYWLYGLLFGVLAHAQLLWALWIYRRPDDERTLMAGAIVCLAVIGVWLVSRIVGLPIGPWAGRPERLGIADISASLDELALAGVVFAMLRPRSRFGAAFGWLRGANCTRAGTALCALSMMALAFSQHTHGS
jgi:hypothetical protein